MNIYVSNLSFNTSDDELNELFSAYGNVSSAKVITDRETGRSRGFGFVEMASTQEGDAAIRGLQNMELEGRTLSVSVAREKSDRSSSDYNRNGGSRNSYQNRKW